MTIAVDLGRKATKQTKGNSPGVLYFVRKPKLQELLSYMEEINIYTPGTKYIGGI